MGELLDGRYAILIDGGFIRTKLKQRNRHFPGHTEILAEIDRIKAHPLLANLDLLRIYFYDAPPATGEITNPIDGTKIDLASHRSYAENTSLQQKLELQQDFAVRYGETSVHGWALGDAALRNIAADGPRMLAANDMVPNIEQKGVDLRIGLDIARLSLRGLVSVIVVLTGDSDMIPAFKFARREGARVYLDHMGHGVKRDLKAHADALL